MKRITFIVPIIAALLIAPLTLLAAPQLTIDNNEFNFGFVPQNSHITHIFKLKSTGDDSLIVTKVVPGCGCTKAPLAKSDLAPGEETELEIIFSTGRYTNTVVKTPRIETNEGPTPKSVKIVSHVVINPDSTHPIAIHPYKLDVSQFGSKTRDEMTFTIENRSGTPVNLTLVDRPEGLFTLELPETIAAGASAEGKLRVNDDALAKTFEKSFTIQLNDIEHSRFTIPVKRELHGTATITPASSK